MFSLFLMSNEETRTVSSFKFSIVHAGMSAEAFLLKRGVPEMQLERYLRGRMPFKPIWYRHIQDKLERRLERHQLTIWMHGLGLPT